MPISKSWYTGKAADPKHFTTNLRDLLADGFRDFPFIIAANPSSAFPVKKAHHYNFLKVMWRLNLISIEAIKRCADALQERTTTSP